MRLELLFSMLPDPLELFDPLNSVDPPNISFDELELEFIQSRYELTLA